MSNSTSAKNINQQLDLYQTVLRKVKKINARFLINPQSLTCLVRIILAKSTAGISNKCVLIGGSFLREVFMLVYLL